MTYNISFFVSLALVGVDVAAARSFPRWSLCCRTSIALHRYEGHIYQTRELSCPDDDFAIKIVTDYDVGHAMQLWNRAKLIKRFPANSSE
jgi:hypothetical protein